MTGIKSGDLVVLKSGGPTMTVDTVNTDIFDDNKITGVLCVWFVGEKLERVRFDHGAIEPVQPEPAQLERALPKGAPSQEASVAYKAVLDEMVDALNLPAEEAKPVCSAAPRKSKRARVKQNDVVRASSVIPN
ncbi:MAG: YodC family protein [Bradyrhizobium sp.]